MEHVKNVQNSKGVKLTKVQTILLILYVIMIHVLKPNSLCRVESVLTSVMHTIVAMRTGNAFISLDRKVSMPENRS